MLLCVENVFRYLSFFFFSYHQSFQVHLPWTELYLLDVLRGLAGDETNMSKKEEKRTLLIIQLAQGCMKQRERQEWKGGG